MFHIALPTSSHPTRRLLDALIDARRRNLSVRVLMDADRDTDPYRSTVINAGAKVYLEAAGVPVRFDPEDRLLHSKFIVIDGSVVIMGSHNWSAGSYFQFDDLSVAIHSQTVGQEQSGRFNSLWEQA
jgi:phosphatidylserine/phosphatidylglycerophosphate/cardiolipin synthase-like enzyme